MLKSLQLISRLGLSLSRSSSSGPQPLTQPILCMQRRPSVQKMEKAYLRLVDGDERLSLNFKYTNAELNVERWFNLSRLVDEPLSDLATRIANNIEKVLSKKASRKKKKSLAPSSDEDAKVQVAFLQDTTPLEPNSASKILAQASCYVHINDILYQVEVNAPSVKNVQLPSCIMADFPVYPRKIEFEFCAPEESKFVWYKMPLAALKKTNRNGNNENPVVVDIPEDSIYWEKASEGFYFIPANDLVDHYLKLECIPQSGERAGLPATAVSSVPVTAGPGACPFDTRHAFTTHWMDGRGFRVVSYNILADLYADSDYTRSVLFPYCPPYALAIDYRKQLFLKEIIGYHADVICLQEVDSKVFEYDLQPLLRSLKYDAVFRVKGGTVVEGLACIFNREKFRLVESCSVVLGEEIQSNPIFADILQSLQQNEALFNRVTARTTSVLICVLESVEHPGRRLVVGNTHLYFHPNADHIRLLQAAVASRLLKQVVVKHESSVKDVRLLLCGDFNSCPEFAVYELFTKQTIPEEHLDWNSCPEEAVKGLSINQDFKMFSACGTPPFTNYVGGFVGCLDYIFCEEHQFAVEQVVPLPSIEEVQEHTALPSVVFPSDHVALVADLLWK